MSHRQNPSIDCIQSTADPAVYTKKLTQVALRRSIMKRTVDQIFDSDERDEIEEEMQESDEKNCNKTFVRDVTRDPYSPDVFSIQTIEILTFNLHEGFLWSVPLFLSLTGLSE